MKKTIVAVALALGLALAIGLPAAASRPVAEGSFTSAFPKGVTRIWIGPEFWANRLQDWRIRDGRLECSEAAADRNVHLLTRALGNAPGGFVLGVRARTTGAPRPARGRNWTGFRVGARGEFDDYRNSAIYGKGLDAGLTSEGALFIGDLESLESELVRVALAKLFTEGGALTLAAAPDGNAYRLKLTAVIPSSGQAVASLERTGVAADALTGNLALVSHLPDFGPAEDGTVSAFEDWTANGERIEVHDDRAFGPILFAQHTLSRGVLKMTAQLPPVGERDGRTVRLQLRKDGGTWTDAGDALFDPDSRTATFRLAGWDGSRDVPYRLLYDLAAGAEGAKSSFAYSGTVRREPIDKPELVLAAFTCQNDVGFPHAEVLWNALAHEPDLLFFSGDQIYERVAGYGTQYEPVEAAILDYLRKWYLFGWAFGDLLRDRPTVTIPDDHDVYHGNLWGAGGKATIPGSGMDAQDSGGYKMPSRWVKMVERTQTSHLPDPVDPAPVEQGIGVYFCEVRYAGLSVAVIEDRKFKSAPKPLLSGAQVRNGWATNPDFKPDKDSDAPGAELLGRRQLAFLRDWAADWSEGVWMKTVFSQTLWADLFTLPAGTRGDDGVPQLPVYRPGEAPPDDVPAADMDSDGWPSSGRNAALREIRKAFALHVCGDQHLPNTVQYGIEAWRDAGYALCVPAISNLWPRRWFPKTPGANHKPGSLPFTGDFKDAFGNRMSVEAVANPRVTGKTPAALYDRAPGYGIVRFDRKSRVATLANWPRDVDPKAPGAKPYPGWPVRVEQLANYGRAAKAYLPTLKFKGAWDPVVQIVEEKTGEIVYTVRAMGDSFRPKVFAPGTYTIRMGEPGTPRWKVRSKVAAGSAASRQILTIDLSK